MILSLDVGFSNMGFSLWEYNRLCEVGVIKTAPSKKKTARTSDEYAWRSAMLAEALKRAIDGNGVSAVIGELPSGGAKSARAMVQMNMATAVVASVVELMDIPCEWCSPSDVKLAVTGKKNATKIQVMDAVAEKYGFDLAPKKGGYVYIFKKARISSGDFEHIADSIGAFEALRHGVIIKMLGPSSMRKAG